MNTVEQPRYAKCQNLNLPGQEPDAVIGALSDMDLQDPRIRILVAEIRRLRVLVAGHAEIVERHIEHARVLRGQISDASGASGGSGTAGALLGGPAEVLCKWQAN